MNCEQTRSLMHAYVDGEVDLIHRVELETHLKGCEACSQRESGLRTLKSTIATHADYFTAPRNLCMIPESTAAKTTSGKRIQWRNVAKTASTVLILIGAGYLIAWLPAVGGNSQSIARAVIAAHVRSLLVDHVVDVASSDRHTVKPWFQGKLPFAPRVVDLSNDGYVLHGGRLDYLVDQPVAAIVYYRRLHVINVFCWPASTELESSIQSQSHQGFHVRTWRRAGLTYWVISDLNDIELDQFVVLLQEYQNQAASNQR